MTTNARENKPEPTEKEYAHDCICKGNNLRIIKKMIKTDEKSVDDLFLIICKHVYTTKNFKLFQYLLDLGVTNLNDSLLETIKHNAIRYTELILLCGVTNVHEAFDIAEKCDDKDMKDLLTRFKLMETDKNKALIDACRFNNYDEVKYILDKSPNNIEEALISTCKRQYSRIVELLLTTESLNIKEALEITKKRKNEEIIVMLTNYASQS
jgi:hypothetical protein